MASAQHPKVLKLLTLGDSGVGKSSLLQRFANNSFSSAWMTTLGVDYKVKDIEIDGETVTLQLWDTAGQERFRCITSTFYRSAHGILLVYDISDQSSFDNIEDWINNIQAHNSGNIDKILIGNKCDEEDKRAVATAAGEQLAKKHGMEFFETSAKASRGVFEAFTTLATIARKSAIDTAPLKTTKQSSNKQIEDIRQVNSSEYSSCSSC